MVLALVPDHAGFSEELDDTGRRPITHRFQTCHITRARASRVLCSTTWPPSLTAGSLVGSDVLVRGSYLAGQKAKQPRHGTIPLHVLLGVNTCPNHEFPVAGQPSIIGSPAGPPNLPRRIRPGAGLSLAPRRRPRQHASRSGAASRFLAGRWRQRRPAGVLLL